MFVVTSTYLKPREEMEALLSDHAQWLREQHEAGIFISSGSNVERTGGAILVQGVDRPTLEALLVTSPLDRAGAARYELIEMSQSPDYCQENA